MMDFELKLEKPNVSRAWISAATMGAAYFIGKLIISDCCVSWLTAKVVSSR
jgi:hypothetical protein